VTPAFSTPSEKGVLFILTEGVITGMGFLLFLFTQGYWLDSESKTSIIDIANFHDLSKRFSHLVAKRIFWSYKSTRDFQ
jgi:hypothetical protein